MPSYKFETYYHSTGQSGVRQKWWVGIASLLGSLSFSPDLETLCCAVSKWPIFYCYSSVKRNSYYIPMQPCQDCWEIRIHFSLFTFPSHAIRIRGCLDSAAACTPFTKEKINLMTNSLTRYSSHPQPIATLISLPHNAHSLEICTMWVPPLLPAWYWAWALLHCGIPTPPTLLISCWNSITSMQFSPIQFYGRATLNRTTELKSSLVDWNLIHTIPEWLHNLKRRV